jgi:hypothetical protein
MGTLMMRRVLQEDQRYGEFIKEEIRRLVAKVNSEEH